MATAIDRPIQQKPLSFEEFLARYGGDNRYELSHLLPLTLTGIEGAWIAQYPTKR